MEFSSRILGQFSLSCDPLIPLILSLSLSLSLSFRPPSTMMKKASQTPQGFPTQPGGLSMDPGVPCPVESYSTNPKMGVLPWKVWAMSEAVRQGLFRPKFGKSMGAMMDSGTGRATGGINSPSVMMNVEECIEAELNCPPPSEQKPNRCRILMMWNLTAFRRRLRELKTAFPPYFHHTVATKSNPLQKIMECAAEEGVGAEAASMGELTMALKCHSPSKIMLDSPAKTIQELDFALRQGVGLTIDNFQELQRTMKLRERMMTEHGTDPFPHRPMGLRINPQIGTGTMPSYSVSKPWSKFGIPSNEKAREVMEAYRTCPWLNYMHCHVGSQSYTMEQIATAIRFMLDLAMAINYECRLKHHSADVDMKMSPADRSKFNQIKSLSIGGGLCVNFDSEEELTSFAQWRDILERVCPELFTGEFQVITEYGRCLLAKAGVIASQVEYTKVCGGRRIVLQHAGADLCVRTVYKPESWPMRVTCFRGEDGCVMHPEQPRCFTSGETLYADIAGPCCFDDVISPSLRPLPRDVCQNDIVMFHDAGAYYHGSFSMYNMRESPAIIVFEEPSHWERDSLRMIDTCDSKNCTGMDVPPTNGQVEFEWVRGPGSTLETTRMFTTTIPEHMRMHPMTMGTTSTTMMGSRGGNVPQRR